jgi:hypothetical protein
MLNPDWLNRDLLEAHSADIHQFIDYRQSTLPNGVRLIEATNSSGLSFTVLPDRGLDIWSATYNGLPLTWLAAGSPYQPDVGQSWLRVFNGGLLVTCGLTHAGPPESEPITDGGKDIHGLYTFMRATDVAVIGGWDDDAGTYVMELRGTVMVGALSREQLRLDRVYRLRLGEPTIEWQDRVTNVGIQSDPLMVLYHVNFGYPLVWAGTQLHTPYHVVTPRDAEAQKGVETWPVYEAAEPDYLEQVFFHHVNADADGNTRVALAHDAFGIELVWNTGPLPYLTQWKNTRTQFYVCGVEPGNCIPEGQVAARDSGRLVMIEPGQSYEFGMAINVLDGADAVQQSRDQIDELRMEGTPAAGCDLRGYV